MSCSCNDSYLPCIDTIYFQSCTRNNVSLLLCNENYFSLHTNICFLIVSTMSVSYSLNNSHVPFIHSYRCTRNTFSVIYTKNNHFRIVVIAAMFYSYTRNISSHIYGTMSLSCSCYYSYISSHNCNVSYVPCIYTTYFSHKHETMFVSCFCNNIYVPLIYMKHFQQHTMNDVSNLFLLITIMFHSYTRNNVSVNGGASCISTCKNPSVLSTVYPYII